MRKEFKAKSRSLGCPRVFFAESRETNSAHCGGLSRDDSEGACARSNACARDAGCGRDDQFRKPGFRVKFSRNLLEC